MKKTVVGTSVFDDDEVLLLFVELRNRLGVICVVIVLF